MAVKVTPYNLLDLLTESANVAKQRSYLNTNEDEEKGQAQQITAGPSYTPAVPASSPIQTPAQIKNIAAPDSYYSSRMDSASNYNMGGKTPVGSLSEYAVAPSAYAAGALDATEGMVKFAPSRISEYYASKGTYQSKRESEGGSLSDAQYMARNAAYKAANQAENDKKAESWANIADSVDLYSGLKRSENALSARQLERMGTSKAGEENVRAEQSRSVSVRDFLNTTHAEMEKIKEETGAKFTLGDMAYTMGQMAPSQVLGAGASKIAGKLATSTELGKLIMDNMLTAKNWNDIVNSAKAVESGTKTATDVFNAVSAANAGMLGEVANVGRTAGSIGSLYAQVYGNSFDEARASGADAKMAAEYARAHAMVEAGTELLGGGVPGMGEGIGTRFVSNLAEKTAARFGGKAVGSVLPKALTAVANVLNSEIGEAALDIFGEGVEEMISEAYDSWIARRTGIDPNREDATWQDIAFAGLIGSLVSATMQGGVAILKSGAQNGNAYTYNDETGKIEKVSASTGTLNESVAKGAPSTSAEADEMSRMAAVRLLNKWNTEGLRLISKELREGGMLYERYGELLSEDELKGAKGSIKEYIVSPLTSKNGETPSWNEIDDYARQLAEQNKLIVEHYETVAKSAEFQKRINDYLPDTVTPGMLDADYVKRAYNADAEIANYMGAEEFAQYAADILNKQIAEDPNKKAEILSGKLNNQQKFNEIARQGADAIRTAFGEDMAELNEAYKAASRIQKYGGSVSVANAAGRSMMVDYNQFINSEYKRVAPNATSPSDLTQEQRDKLTAAFNAASEKMASERESFIKSINERTKGLGVTVKIDPNIKSGVMGDSSPDGKTIRLNPRISNADALRYVYAHEMLHSAIKLAGDKKTVGDVRRNFTDYVFDIANSIGFDMTAEQQELVKLKYSPNKAREEASIRFLTALLGSSDMLMALSDKNPNALHDVLTYLEEKAKQTRSADKAVDRADASIRANVRKAENGTLKAQLNKEAAPLAADIPQAVKDAAVKPAGESSDSVEGAKAESAAAKPSDTEAEYEEKDKTIGVFTPNIEIPQEAKDVGFRKVEQKVEKKPKKKAAAPEPGASDVTSVPLAGIPGLKLVLDEPVGGKWTTIRVIPDDTHEFSKNKKFRKVTKEEGKVLRSLGFNNNYGVYTHDYNKEFWRRLLSATPADIESQDAPKANKLHEYKADNKFNGLYISFVNEGYDGKIRVIYRDSNGYRRPIPEELYYALAGRKDEDGLGFARDKDNVYGNTLYATYSDHLWELLGGEPMTRMMRDKMNFRTALRANLFESGDLVPCTAPAFKGFDISYNALNNTLSLWKDGTLAAIADYDELVLEAAFGDSNLSDIFSERSADLARVNEVIRELASNNSERRFWSQNKDMETHGDRQAELNYVFGSKSEGEEERVEDQLGRASRRKGMIRVKYPNSDWEYYPKAIANSLAGVTSKGGIEGNRRFIDESYIRTNPAGGKVDARETYIDPETGRAYRYSPDSMPRFIIDNDTGKIVWDASKYDPKKAINDSNAVKVDRGWFVDNAAAAKSFEEEYDTSNEVKGAKNATKEDLNKIKEENAAADKAAVEKIAAEESEADAAVSEKLKGDAKIDESKPSLAKGLKGKVKDDTTRGDVFVKRSIIKETTEAEEQENDTSSSVAAAGSDVTGKYAAGEAAEADTAGKYTAADAGYVSGGFAETAAQGSSISEAMRGVRSDIEMSSREARTREYYKQLRDERDAALEKGKAIAEEVESEKEARFNRAGMTTRYANSYTMEELKNMFPGKSAGILSMMQTRGGLTQKLAEAREAKDWPTVKATKEKIAEIDAGIKAVEKQENDEILAGKKKASAKKKTPSKPTAEMLEERNRNALKNKKEDFNGRIEETKRAITKLREDLAKEKTVVESDLTRFRYSNSSVEKELAGLKKDISELESKIRIDEKLLEGKTDKKLPSELKNLDPMLVDVRKRIAETSELLENARKVYEEKGFQRYKDEITRLESELESEIKKAEKREKSLLKMKSDQKETAKVNISERLEKAKNSLAEKRRDYESKLAAVSGENWNARHEAEISRIENSIVNAEADIKNYKKEIASINKELKKMAPKKLTLDELASKAPTKEEATMAPETVKADSAEAYEQTNGRGLMNSEGAVIEPSVAEYYMAMTGGMNKKGELQVYYSNADNGTTLQSFNDMQEVPEGMKPCYAAIASPLYAEDTVSDYPEVTDAAALALEKVGFNPSEAGQIVMLSSAALNRDGGLVNKPVIKFIDQVALAASAIDKTRVSALTDVRNAILTELGRDGIVFPDGAYVLDDSQIKDTTDTHPENSDESSTFTVDDSWWDNFNKQYDSNQGQSSSQQGNNGWQWEDPTEHQEENNRQWEDLGKRNGTMGDTGIPNRVGNDGKKVTTTMENIWSAPGLRVDDTPLDAASKAAILQGMLDYIPTTHVKELAEGQRWLQNYASETVEGKKTQLTAKDFARAYQNWMMEGDVNNKEQVIHGGQLAAEMANFARSNPDKVDPAMNKAWAFLIAKLASGGSNAGQTLNAYGVLKKLTPQGRLYYLENMIDQMRKEFEDPKGWLKKNLKGVLSDYVIPPDYIDELMNCKAGDQAALDAVEDKIAKDVADHIPATWESRLIAYRYLCMLGNGKTHVRNIASNMASAIVKDLARNISGKIQDKKLAPGEKTVSWENRKVSEATKQFAQEDAIRQKDVLQLGGKQGFQSKIRQNQKSFSSDFMNALNKINSYGIESKKYWFLNGLEGEDWHFLEREYVKSLSRYMTANDLTPEYFATNNKEALEKLNKARSYAIRQAQEATYRQANILATKLNELSKKNPIANLVISGVAPFLRTPMNIAVTGFRYSPMGLLETLYDSKTKVESGEMTPAEVIDRLGQNLSGTGVFLLGMALALMGKLKASGKESDKEEYYDQMLGEQRYSIDIGGTNYTLDWLTPVSMPLFAGAEVLNAMKRDADIDDEEDFAEVLARVASAAAMVADPLVNLSMLSGVNEALSGFGNENKFQAFISTAAQNYLLQFIPTLSGQALRTFEPERKTTYAPSNPNYPLLKTGKTFVNKLKNKSIVANLLLGDNNAYVDQWGRKEGGEDNIAVRAFNQFIAPWYSRDYNRTEVDDKLAEVFASNGSTSVLPGTPQSYYKISGDYYRLSGDEFEKVKTLVGNLSYRGLEDAFAYDVFNDLDPDVQAKVISDIYGYSKEIAKIDYADSREDVEIWGSEKEKKEYMEAHPDAKGFIKDSDVDKIETASEYGMGVGQYYTIKELLSGMKKKDKQIILVKMGIPRTLRDLFL